MWYVHCMEMQGFPSVYPKVFDQGCSTPKNVYPSIDRVIDVGWSNSYRRGWKNDWWRDLSIHAYVYYNGSRRQRGELYSIDVWSEIISPRYLFCNMLQESVTKSYVIITIIQSIHEDKGYIRIRQSSIIILST